jgi:hypothetical protein
MFASITEPSSFVHRGVTSLVVELYTHCEQLVSNAEIK